MEQKETLILTRGTVARLLNIDECIAGVENAFRLHAEGKALPPKVMGIPTPDGGFHIKAGIFGIDRTIFVAKVNANFPGNATLHGLPTIQGIIVVCNGANGRLLALMDSIEITIIRTGAATAVAAKYLATANANTATICGCGNQGSISLKALMKVRQLTRLYAFDIDQSRSRKFAQAFSGEMEVIPISANELHHALRHSQICVSCTPSREPFIRATDIMPGTFIAAVGADSEEKQEIFSDLMATSKIVVDLADQSASIGELHHAIKQGLLTTADIHSDLGSIIAGKKTGRESESEIIIFDSTGTALQDAAAAAIVYTKALHEGMGTKLNFSK